MTVAELAVPGDDDEIDIELLGNLEHCARASPTRTSSWTSPSTVINDRRPNSSTQASVSSTG